MFIPTQLYTIPVTGTASPAQYLPEIATLRAAGKTPVLNFYATGCSVIKKLGSVNTILASDVATDIVTNGTYASDVSWTEGAGWTISGAVANAAGAISTSISQVAPLLVAGLAYATSFVTTRSAGGVYCNIGGTQGTLRSTANTFAEVIIAGSTGSIGFDGAGFTGTVDTFTAKPYALVAGNSVCPVLISKDEVPGEGISHVSTISSDHSSTGTLYVTVGYNAKG